MPLTEFSLSSGNSLLASLSRADREHVIGACHNVELIWRGFLEPTWVDIRPGANVLMTFTMVMAKDAEVIVNGKKAPGRVVPGGRGSFPPSFLALNETWRR